MFSSIWRSKDWTITLVQSVSTDKETIEQLQAKIKDLQKELERSKLRSGLFETMIEVADERCNISIRKKSGAKQSLDTWRRNQKPE